MKDTKNGKGKVNTPCFHLVMVARETERNIMKTIELITRTILQVALIAALAFGCVHFLSGCTILEKANASEKLVTVMKETYANGGAEAVSNKIEKLVADGTISVKQAEALHIAAQRLYDGVVEKLEAKAAESTETN